MNFSNIRGIERYAALLHKEWEITSDETVVGFWGEDNSHYSVDLPDQLKHLLVNLQNTLSKKYQLLEFEKRKLNKLEKELNAVFDSQHSQKSWVEPFLNEDEY